MDDGCGGSMVVEDMSVRERRKRRERRVCNSKSEYVCVCVEGGWCSYVSFEISLSRTSPIPLDEKKKKSATSHCLKHVSNYHKQSW